MSYQLFLGDCVQVMYGMEDNSVDLTVTSPPYDNLRKYKGYVFDFEKTARQLYRVTRKGGVAVWVVGDSTVNGSETGTPFRQALYFKEIGFNLHDTMIYKRWSGPLTHNRYEQEFEYMFVFSKGRPRIFNPIMIDCKQGGQAWKRLNGGGASFTDENTRRFRKREHERIIKAQRIDGNIWELPNASQKKEHNGHPAPFPEELARRHIVSWSNKGDTVLDPFVGSGTTGKMALLNKRNFIGIEIASEYFEIAKKRIEAVV